MADFTNDGNMDVATINSADNSATARAPGRHRAGGGAGRLFRGSTAGLGTEGDYVAGKNITRLTTADVDGDGWLDVVAHQYNSGSFTVLLSAHCP